MKRNFLESQARSAALARKTRKTKCQAKNRRFVESYNDYVGCNGVFGEELQDWDAPTVDLPRDMT